jgi:hypothetical protein
MSDQQAPTRESISLAIKDSIRSFYQRHEKMKVSDMVLWAEEKYGIPFLPATMRTILFPKQKKLPLWTAPRYSFAERKREKPPSWPELELELSRWYASSTAPPKGQKIKEKAIDLWRELAPKHYTGQEQPSFGDSWRDKFKKRHGFKLRKAPAKEIIDGSEASIAVIKGLDEFTGIGEAINTTSPQNVCEESDGIRVTQSLFSGYKTTDFKICLHWT